MILAAGAASTKDFLNRFLSIFTDFGSGHHRHCSTTALGRGEGGCSGGEGGGRGGDGGGTVDGVMGGNDGGDVAVAVAANAAPGGGGGGGGGGERRGSMVIRVQMLDDSISLFQVQVSGKERDCGKNVSKRARCSDPLRDRMVEELVSFPDRPSTDDRLL